MAAIARGAAMYGLSIGSVISSRVLKYTYGVAYGRKWEKGDPIDKKTPDGMIINLFKRLAKRGNKMNINEEVKCTRVPMYSDQTRVTHHIYYTKEYNATYCDEPSMKLLGEFSVDLPGSGTDRSVLFGMAFGKMEVTATSKDKQTGQSYKTTFKFNFDI
ncbi:unnamed protein product [Rhizophagus irregularis]|nr:unnamed protein product [Rhizophagus irregularis]